MSVLAVATAEPVQLRVRPAPGVDELLAYRVPRHPAPVDLALDGNEGAVPPADLLEGLVDGRRAIDERRSASLRAIDERRSASLRAIDERRSASLRAIDERRSASLRAIDALRLYPSARALEELVAARHGVTPDRVLVTAGADDGLDRACRAMLGPGRELILPVPTFEMLARYARVAHGTIVEVPWDDGAYPLGAVLGALEPHTGLIAVISPNNPTGLVADRADVSALALAAAEAEGAPLVLLDQAYGEFADEDLTPAGLAHDNVLVLRTLSKAHGLAGLRVGYALGHPDVIGWLRAVGPPYAVSGPSLLLAGDWLLRGPDVVAGFVAGVRAQRRELSDLLVQLGARVTASQANFVFARVRDAMWVRDGLAGLGIGVRAFPGRALLQDAVRITVPGPDGSAAGSGSRASSFQRLCAGLRVVLRPAAGDWVMCQTVDEVQAARARGELPLGLLPGGADPQPLLRAGAARVMSSAAEVEALRASLA